MEDEEQGIEFDVNIVMKETFKEKVDWFSSNYENEIAGFIIGEINEEGIILEDLLIPEQEVGTASISLKGKDLVKLRKEYGDKCKKIIGEWHSHNDMGCMWSYTDEEDFIKPFSEPREVTIFVVSSKGEHLIRMEIRKPFFMSLDKLSYVVESKENDKLQKQLEREIKKKVKEAEEVSIIDTTGRGTGRDYNYPLFTNFKERKRKAKMMLTDMWKFYNGVNVLKLVGLTEEQAESLGQEFEKLKPIVVIGGMSIYDSSVAFKFKNKNEAINKMKEIRTFLLPLLIEEVEEEEPEEEISYV